MGAPTGGTTTVAFLFTATTNTKTHTAKPMGNDAIKYELGLVVAAAVVFAVWQWWELKRDGRLLRERRERERAQERAEAAAQAAAQARAAANAASGPDQAPSASSPLAPPAAAAPQAPTAPPGPPPAA